MAPRNLPGLGLRAYAPKGEANWNTWTDPNWRTVSALLQGRVKGLVAALPGSPVDGDMYILTATANANRIAIRDAGAWVYIVPQTGWRMYETTDAITYEFDGTAWVADTLQVMNGSNTDAAPTVTMKKRGSPAGATAPNAAYASLGSFRWMGWTGTAWRVGAQMLVQTQQLWSASVSGTAIVWRVIANGSTALVDRLTLTDNALLPAQTDRAVSLGGRTTRWLKGWFGNISLYPDASAYPSDNGELTIASYADDTITMLKKGADGTVRKIDLTLTP